MAARRAGTEWLGAALFGSAAVATCGLGTWQLQRYQWKHELVARRRRMQEHVPVALGEARGEPYERVRCEGTFEYDQSMLVGPRSAPASAAQQGQSALSPTGFVVVTPFTDRRSGRRILVNRGWIPRNRPELAAAVSEDVVAPAMPATPAAPIASFWGWGLFGSAGAPVAAAQGPLDAAADAAADAVVSFEGVIGVDEDGGTFTPTDAKATQSTKMFFAVNAKTMARAKGLPDDTFLVDRVGGPGPLVSKSLESMLNFKVHPATHLGYAATWYGISVAAVVFLRKRFFRAAPQL
jgi:cytochrome oxidase assembly protein ShyY1